VGTFAEHRVIEQSVAGLGVVAPPIQLVVVRVVRWDHPQVWASPEIVEGF
jgi:hypothetical protein